MWEEILSLSHRIDVHQPSFQYFFKPASVALGGFFFAQRLAFGLAKSQVPLIPDSPHCLSWPR